MKNIKTIAIASTAALILLLGFLSIYVVQEYGWTVFLLSPFIVGFLPVYIIGKSRKITLKEAYKYGFLTLAIVCVGLLVFAIEGLVCIIMASPFLAFAVWLGSFLGYFASEKDKWNGKNVSSVIVIFSMGFMSFDYLNEPTASIPVKTEIIINASIEEVWHNVVTFDKIEEPTDWLFKTGIAYPTHATIKGTGVGAVRYCNFTTGSFVEPISKWQEPNLLQFDVVDQPAPMNEFNPFWDIHPQHLDGYFMSHKGQFKLTKLGDNKTKLEGTTWYSVDITPEFYWRWWSDFIIHRIHKRVLDHIKKEAEQSTKEYI